MFIVLVLVKILLWLFLAHFNTQTFLRFVQKYYNTTGIFFHSVLFFRIKLFQGFSNTNFNSMTFFQLCCNNGVDSFEQWAQSTARYPATREAQSRCSQYAGRPLLSGSGTVEGHVRTSVPCNHRHNATGKSLSATKLYNILWFAPGYFFADPFRKSVEL